MSTLNELTDLLIKCPLMDLDLKTLQQVAGAFQLSVQWIECAREMGDDCYCLEYEDAAFEAAQRAIDLIKRRN